MYALVRHPASVPKLAGIDGQPLRALVVDAGVDAIVSETGTQTVASEEAILAHARVVDALASTNDGVLPARFAGDVAAEADLSRLLAGRRDRILEALDRVDKCVELGLRVLPAQDDEPGDVVSGGEYMRRRLDEIARAQKLANTLHAALADVARESTCSVLARRDIVFTGAYLVPRGDVDRFRARLKEAEQQVAGVTIVLTGPWPPYTFVVLEAEGP